MFSYTIFICILALETQFDTDLQSYRVTIFRYGQTDRQTDTEVLHLCRTEGLSFRSGRQGTVYANVNETTPDVSTEQVHVHSDPSDNVAKESARSSI